MAQWKDALYPKSPVTKSKRDKRLAEIALLLEKFQDLCKKTEESGCASIELIENAAGLINDNYWEIIESHVRPLLNDYPDRKKIIHHSKIISVLELCIMGVLPILHSDEESRINLNAVFAVFVAKNIVFGWNKLELQIHEEFEREHIKWLQSVNLDSFPILCNSFNWVLYESYFKAKNNNRLFSWFSKKAEKELN